MEIFDELRAAVFVFPWIFTVSAFSTFKESSLTTRLLFFFDEVELVAGSPLGLTFAVFFPIGNALAATKLLFFDEVELVPGSPLGLTFKEFFSFFPLEIL